MVSLYFFIGSITFVGTVFVAVYVKVRVTADNLKGGLFCSTEE